MMGDFYAAFDDDGRFDPQASVELLGSADSTELEMLMRAIALEGKGAEIPSEVWQTITQIGLEAGTRPAGSDYLSMASKNDSHFSGSDPADPNNNLGAYTALHAMALESAREYRALEARVTALEAQIAGRKGAPVPAPTVAEASGEQGSADGDLADALDSGFVGGRVAGCLEPTAAVRDDERLEADAWEAGVDVDVDAVELDDDVQVAGYTESVACHEEQAGAEQRLDVAKRAREAAKGRALLQEAASMHFLTDRHAGGHAFDKASVMAATAEGRAGSGLGAPALPVYLTDQVARQSGLIQNLVVHNVHDAWNADGVEVHNDLGDSWTAFGDGHWADAGNSENRRRTAESIYSSYAELLRVMDGIEPLMVDADGPLSAEPGTLGEAGTRAPVYAAHERLPRVGPKTQERAEAMALAPTAASGGILSHVPDGVELGGATLKSWLSRKTAMERATAMLLDIEHQLAASGREP